MFIALPYSRGWLATSARFASGILARRFVKTHGNATMGIRCPLPTFIHIAMERQPTRCAGKARSIQRQSRARVPQTMIGRRC